MSRVSRWAGAVLVLAGGASQAIAANVVVEISGTLGDIGYGNQPALLNGGSFSGSVTFASLPTANSQSVSETASVNFYDASNHFLFNVGHGVLFDSYDTLNAGASGYTSLGVGGTTSYAGDTIQVAGLSLTFANWSFGSAKGTVIGYGDPSYGSYISYTDATTSTPYSSSVLSGQAIVPEPSTMALGLLGMVGVLAYARFNRRNGGRSRDEDIRMSVAALRCFRPR